MEDNKQEITIGPIDSFGYKIFRLLECGRHDEFLLYCKDSRNYYQFDEARLLSVLLKKIESKNINLYDFIVNDLKNEGKFKVKDELQKWINNEYLQIENIGYKPNEDFLTFEENDKIYFNIYKKSKILKDFKIIKNPEFPLIKDILLNVLGNNENGYNWFINWIAHSVQFPEERLPTAVIFHGEHGTGKNIICSNILKRIFESNYNEISQTQITSQFNDWAMGKQLIIANEVIHNDNKTYVPDKLKNLVADDYIPLRRMHKSPVMLKNYAKYIFTSNHMIPLKIENGDRRFSVFKSYKLKDGSKKYKELMQNINKETNNFLSYILNLNIDKELISKPFENRSRNKLIKFNQNSIEEFITYSKETGGFKKLYDYYLSTINDSILKDYTFDYIDKSFGKYVKVESLYFLYKKFCDDFGYIKSYARKNFTQVLEFIGFEFKVVKGDNNISTRCMEIKEDDL